VVDLTTVILEVTGGLEELYYYRGLARQALGQPQAAAEDWRAALAYNPHFEPAARALQEGAAVGEADPAGDSM
jgi:tetratricopeptide (TPR) repeat protein